MTDSATRTVQQIIDELRAPFHPDDLQWRIGEAGEKKGRVWALVFPYIDDRAIQDRLDEVVGPENWEVSYEGMNGDATTCTIAIRLNGEWIKKSNGAGATDIEGIKGSYSGASKRTASVWGIGRYIYKLKNTYAIMSERKTGHRAVLKSSNRRNSSGEDIWYNWIPPELPIWAMPKNLKYHAPQEDDSPEVKARYEACIEALKKATNIQKVDQIIIAAEKEWNPWKEEWQDEVTKLGIKREKELAS